MNGYPVSSLAKKVCEVLGWNLSQLKLQKILYVCHMYYMGQTGNPLCNEPFQAWNYGPVIESLYHRLKRFGAKNIKDVFFEAGELPPQVNVFLEKFCPQFAKVSSAQLVEYTHRKNGAWERSYSPGVRRVEISNADIVQEFRGKTVAKAS